MSGSFAILDHSQPESGDEQQQQEKDGEYGFVIDRRKAFESGRLLDCLGQVLIVFVLRWEGLERGLQLLLQRVDFISEEVIPRFRLPRLYDEIIYLIFPLN